jgi:hypothetical protein
MSRVENRLAIFGWEKSVADFAGSISEKPTGGGPNRYYSVALLGFFLPKWSCFPTSKKPKLWKIHPKIPKNSRQ